MRASFIALVVAVCACSPLRAGPKETAEAEASLRLHLALQQAVGRDAALAPRPADGVVVKRPDYATAYYQSIKDGKPLVIHVNGFDCKDACKECLAAGACLTCDAAEILGDSTPRMILAAPTGGKLLKANEWRTAPTAGQIKAAIGECSENCPNGACAPGQSCGSSGGPVQSFGGGCANGQCSPASGFRLLRR